MNTSPESMWTPPLTLSLYHLICFIMARIKAPVWVRWRQAFSCRFFMWCHKGHWYLNHVSNRLVYVPWKHTAGKTKHLFKHKDKNHFSQKIGKQRAQKALLSTAVQFLGMINCVVLLRSSKEIKKEEKISRIWVLLKEQWYVSRHHFSDYQLLCPPEKVTGRRVAQCTITSRTLSRRM